ncbi:hypothetical protein LTR04_006315 [Oleoguttula sp. CCFEE 6159]|nr:hypothetical protein LTR04_006315 [Oleoguttula sp. CCFEE 6159]
MVKRSRKDSASSSSSSLYATTPASTPTASEPEHATKYTQLDADTAASNEVMRCLLPPHSTPVSFSSYEDYEVHYRQQHTNRCSECGKNLPTEHFLNLHIAENHDSLMEARRARGEKTYACFVEDCDRVCSAPHKRRLHLIDKHMFPRDYHFFIVNDGLDKRVSMLRSCPRHRRQSSAADRALQRQRSASNVSATTVLATNRAVPESSKDHETVDAAPFNTCFVSAGTGRKSAAQETPVDKADMAMDDITTSMSSLKFVPQSIRFGRGAARGGLARS